MSQGIAEYLQDPSATNETVLSSLVDYVEVVAWWALGPAPFVVIGAVSFVWLRNRNQAELLQGGRILRLAMPPTVDPSGAVIFWSNLHDLLRPAWKRFWHGQPHLSFEYVWRGPELHLQIWIPSAVSVEIVRRAALSAWPGVAVTDEAAAELFAVDVANETGRFRLTLKEWFSIKTDHEADPLRTVIGSVGNLDVYQSASVQVVARPVTGSRTAKAMRAAKRLRSGKSASIGLRLLDLIQPGVSTGVDKDNPMRNADIRAITAKASSVGWEVEIRYAVADAVRDRGKTELRHRAHGLASSFSVFTGRNRLRRTGIKVERLNSRQFGNGELFSVDELAGVAHLPADYAIPGLDRAGAKSVEPLPSIDRSGLLLGDSDGERRPVAIGDRDSCYHLHVLGSTGSGKSNLLTNLILGDIEAGKGGVVIDPKGDLVNDVLERLPASMASRVVLLDPAYQSISPSLDVLGNGKTHLAVENIVGIFSRIYEANWGPRTDDVFRTACLTLRNRYEHEASLVDVPKLLSDSDYRHDVVANLDDATLRGFWEEYDAMTVGQRSQLTAPLMNKLRAFMLRGFLRDTVGRTNRTFDLHRIFDDTFFLVRVPKGVIGDETSRLIGSLVVARVWQVGLSRAQLATKSRSPVRLYVDECQNFLNLPRSFDEMLAEARGYGLSLVLAHQHLGQLSRELRTAISANARNKLYFTMSPEDARELVRHFEPELSAHDLSHLGAYQIAARLVANGRDQAGFTLRTREASKPTELNVLTIFAGTAPTKADVSARKAASQIDTSLKHRRPDSD